MSPGKKLHNLQPPLSQGPLLTLLQLTDNFLMLQNWKLDTVPGCILMTTEKEKIIVFIKLEAICLLIQPWLLLLVLAARAHCWFTFSLPLTHQQPQGLLSRAAPQSVHPQPMVLQGALASSICPC